MNLSEYISSGILEAYVMDELGPKEAQKVRLKAQEYPEVQTEINAIEEVLMQLALTGEKIIPIGVKEKIIRQVDDQRTQDEERRTISKNVTWQIAASVSGIIAIATSVLLFLKTERLHDAEMEISKLLSSQTQLVERLDQTNHTLAQTESNLQSIISPSARVIHLSGQSFAAEAAVKIYWNPDDRSVYLSNIQLPTIDDDEQFQLWYLLDGQPFDAGLLLKETELQRMKDVFTADAFAITIEPTGGSNQPTLEKLVVLGEVG
jgi:anti-sigma-K factor RskA